MNICRFKIYFIVRRTHTCTQTHIVVLIHYTNVSAAYIYACVGAGRRRWGGIWTEFWTIQAGYEDIVGWLGVHTPTRVFCMESTWAAGICYQRDGDSEGDRSWPQSSMAAAGHWCIHVAGLVALSLQAVAPEQTAIRSGTVRFFLAALAFDGVGQRTWCCTPTCRCLWRWDAEGPLYVLFRCTTVGGKGRGVVYAPHIFTLAHLQERDVWRRYSSLQVVLSHGRNHCWSC